MSEPIKDLFAEPFIEYVKAIFFTNPKRKFTTQEMLNNMPSFYKDQDMVNAAVHILLMRGDLVQLPLTTTSDEYQANEKAKEIYDKEVDIDRQIKLVTKENLLAQRFPLKWWPLISVFTIALSAFSSYLVNKLTKDPPTQPIIRTEQMRQIIQSQIDTGR